MIVSGNRPPVSSASTSTAPKHAAPLFEQSLAKCIDPAAERNPEWGCIDGWCPRHDPEEYAANLAQHRRDSA